MNYELKEDGKLYNEYGFVAVLITCDYGAGWSTWNINPELALDGGVAKLILEGCNFDKNELRSELMKVSTKGVNEDTCVLGYDSLIVAWIDKGKEFIINEYDGLEGITFKEEVNWVVA